MVHLLLFCSHHKLAYLKQRSTEFVSLSDWMRESTLFNVIGNINFFKTYIISLLSFSFVTLSSQDIPEVAPECSS